MRFVISKSMYLFSSVVISCCYSVLSFTSFSSSLELLSVSSIIYNMFHHSRCLIFVAVMLYRIPIILSFNMSRSKQHSMVGAKPPIRIFAV